MEELPDCFGVSFSVLDRDCLQLCLVRDRCVVRLAQQLLPQQAQELGFPTPDQVPAARWQDALELDGPTVGAVLRVWRGVPVKVALESPVAVPAPPAPVVPAPVVPATESPPAPPPRKKRPPPTVPQAGGHPPAPSGPRNTLAPVERGPAWDRAFERERARSEWVGGLPEGWRAERELAGVRYGASLDLAGRCWVDHEGRTYPTLYRLTMELTGSRRFPGQKARSGKGQRPDRVMSNWSARKFWGRKQVRD